MTNLDDEKLEFTLKGEKYAVDYPSVELYEQLIENLSGGKLTESQCFFVFMEGMGIEKEVVRKMSLPQLRKLTKASIEGK